MNTDIPNKDFSQGFYILKRVQITFSLSLILLFSLQGQISLGPSYTAAVFHAPVFNHILSKSKDLEPIQLEPFNSLKSFHGISLNLAYEVDLLYLSIRLSSYQQRDVAVIESLLQSGQESLIHSYRLLQGGIGMGYHSNRWLITTGFYQGNWRVKRKYRSTGLSEDLLSRNTSSLELAMSYDLVQDRHLRISLEGFYQFPLNNINLSSFADKLNVDGSYTKESIRLYGVRINLTNQ